MAKRNVRRAREQGRAPITPSKSSTPPTRASTFRSRQFWLGVVAAACVLIPLAVVGIVLAGRDTGDVVAEAPSATGSPTPDPSVESEAESLAQASQTRDKSQVEELTAHMRQLSDDLGPAVSGVEKTLPSEDDRKVGPLASRADVQAWVKATSAAQEWFAVPPSGDTGTNVARGALAAAVRGFAEMVETYQIALDRPALRAELLERTRSQRDNAMKAWETASTQMDVVNIAVGFGHQHPSPPGRGAAAPDGLPEGTDATDGG